MFLWPLVGAEQQLEADIAAVDGRHPGSPRLDVIADHALYLPDSEAGDLVDGELDGGGGGIADAVVVDEHLAGPGHGASPAHGKDGWPPRRPSAPVE